MYFLGDATETRIRKVEIFESLWIRNVFSKSKKYF